MLAPPLRPGRYARLVGQGRGPPVLLLHGNPDAADLPGFGRSLAPDDPDRSLGGMARFVAALPDAAGVEEPLHCSGPQL